MGYPEVTEEQFEEQLKDKLGLAYPWALDLSQRCGRFLTFDIVNILLHAVEKNKVGAVLDKLEEHYRDHLAYHHPDIQGTVSAGSYNPTHAVFRGICEDILGLQPADWGETT